MCYELAVRVIEPPCSEPGFSGSFGVEHDEFGPSGSLVLESKRCLEVI
jgi:hypothetical protein